MSITKERENLKRTESYRIPKVCIFQQEKQQFVTVHWTELRILNTNSLVWLIDKWCRRHRRLKAVARLQTYYENKNTTKTGMIIFKIDRQPDLESWPFWVVWILNQAWNVINCESWLVIPTWIRFENNEHDIRWNEINCESWLVILTSIRFENNEHDIRWNVINCQSWLVILT